MSIYTTFATMTESVLAEVFAVTGRNCTSCYTHFCVRDGVKKLIKIRLSLDHNDCNAPTLFVYTEYVTASQCQQVKGEMMASNMFREYKIQGNTEPRLHIMYHKKATSASNTREDTRKGTQYGYRQVQ